MSDPTTDRDPLELLAAEYMERLRRGETPSVEEYATQHPALAGEIHELFPTIAVTERLKAKQARSSGGLATLGAAQLERLGDFRIIREIGRGGMGVVFEAEQESLGRRVAVKVLPRQVLLDEKHLKRFEREARVAASLHHTNIVEIFGVGEQDGFHYYVMQYIRGAGLDAILPQLAESVRSPASGQPRQSPAADSAEAMADGAARELLGLEFDGCVGSHYWQSVAKIGLQAAEALHYAHDQGVLHRDIKPANLLLDKQGTVWLADFGLAKATQSEDISVSQDLVGTLRYMPPEQFRGQTDHRADIYGLGLTLYELLVFQPAYAETDHTRLMQRIAEGGPTPPSDLTKAIPRDLETIVLKAISHDVSQRYQSAEALADDLRNFIEDRPIQARRVGQLERLGRWSRRNPVVAGLAATTALLLVAIAVVSSMGYVRTQRALAGEAAARAKAEANAQLAVEALDRIFDQIYSVRTSVRAEPVLAGMPGELVDIPSVPILPKETAALLEEILPFYDRLAQQTGNSDDLRLRTAEANRRVGNIRQRLGHTKEAVQAYQRAITIFQELGSRSSATFDLNLKLAQSYNELGRIFTAQRQFSHSLESHEAARSLLQPADEPSVSPLLRFELARTYFFLGLRERPLPKTEARDDRGASPGPGEQRTNLIQAVTLLKELSGKSPGNPEYQHLLALCYLEGAPMGNERGAAARGGNEQAIALLESLVSAYPGSADYTYDLSEAYARMHIPRPPVPPDLEAQIEERLGKALALLEALVTKHPEAPEFLAFEARVYHKRGSFYQQVGHWPEAEHSFRSAIACQQRLLAQFPDVQPYVAWMTTYRFALADALFRQSQPTAARTEIEETIAALRTQLEQKPDLNSLHELLASSYTQLEKLLRKTGERSEAEAAARKAKAEREMVLRSD